MAFSFDFMQKNCRMKLDYKPGGVDEIFFVCESQIEGRGLEATQKLVQKFWSYQPGGRSAEKKKPFRILSHQLQYVGKGERYENRAQEQ